MNLLKKLTAGALAVVAMTGMASATTPTIIHICGSTAFRSPVTCAIIAQLNSSGSCYGAGNNSTILKAQSGIFANGTVTYSSGVFTGTATTIILSNWTGSLAGCVDVAAQNSTLAFPNPQDPTVEADLTRMTGTTSAGGVLATGFSTVTSAPEVAMSDSFATSAAAVLYTANIASGHNIGGATTGPALSTLVKNAPLVEAGTSSLIVNHGAEAGYLGIVPFEWVLGADNGVAGGVAPFTNITHQTANYLIKNGSAPFTMFATNNISSSPNSAADYVYLIGRNEDSGTRIDSFAEPQLGFVQNPVQYLLTFSGGSNTSDIPAPVDFTQIGSSTAKVETMNPWTANAPLNTELNISWSNAGHGGYAGGGDVASVLGTPVDEANISGSGFAGQNSGDIFFIGYLGISDAGGFGTTTINNGTALTYNGVTASAAACQNGSYSFWSYEHMYYLGSGTSQISSTEKTIVDAIANSLASTYVNYGSSGTASSAPGGVFLLPSSTAGSVIRSVEGGGMSLTF